MRSKERFLDGTGDRFDLQGVKVGLTTVDPADQLFIRFDTSQEVESFGDMLTRERRPTTPAKDTN